MKTKKLIKNIVIAAVVVVLIVAAILLTLALRKDGRGLNWFERNRKVASADGVSVSMIEYALTLDSTLSNYSYYSIDVSNYTDEQMRSLQENAAKQTLLLKIYSKEAKALGLTLTDEEVQQCRDTASKQIKDIEENYAKSLAQQGNYSKAALEKQLASYYQQIGLNQNQYYTLIYDRAASSYYATKIDAYYEENGSGFEESELMEFYHKSVEEAIDAYDELDEESRKDYFSNMIQYYYVGYGSPALFVPEGFIYVDYIRLEKESAEEINGIIEKVQNGELTFDELLDSEDNKDPYKNTLMLPYAMGKDDHGYLFSDDAAYEAAAALEIGEIGSYVAVPDETETDDNATAQDASSDAAETKTVTGYVFRRAEGNMCEEGDSGIVKIDYYPGIRQTAESELREERWFSDAKYEDAIYAYRGQN